ncbi:hypothetical protein EXIGLDRAFT_768943 [Exidia glandulosa HHB12029]|uniref:CHCH domain-containing protein n=1 Tax=Exidia glandulosa HHB12029 TaxID=1314781 RepID=A0A165HV43_EXIGL|nr:hypothetical protein EXIGLDRAFT_768943 [Exidia glandulosa HHB12029]
MSFGRPPQLTNFSVLPPDRGSFPLDHDGECKAQMMKYMKCLQSHGNSSIPCRVESGQYLECRMNGLMERDEWRNLGLADVMDKKDAPASTPAAPASDKTASSKGGIKST